MSPSDLVGLGIPEELVVLIVSALPFIELRGALPAAINVFKMAWHYSLLLALTGNILPVPFLLLFFNTIVRYLSRMNLLDRMFRWLFQRTRRKGRIIDRYKRVGLLLLVAIPLPGSGAWTGSLAAVLFGVEFKYAFLSIFLGVLIAGIIVTCLCLLGWTGAIIAGIGLTGLAVFSLWKSRTEDETQPPGTGTPS